MVEPRWRRIVFKPSGEALAGPTGSGIDGATLDNTAHDIIDLRQGLGVDVAVVVGGGNFWRGRTGAMAGMDATQSDHIGMLGTVMNALALQDALERLGQPTRVQSAIEMPRIAEPYIRRRAVRHLEKGRVVIFAAGTGQPVLHHRHRGGPAGRRDRRRGADQGHPLRRRRRLRRRPADQPRRRQVRRDRLHGRDEPRPAGDGRHGHRLLPRQQDPDRRVRHVHARAACGRSSKARRSARSSADAVLAE